MVKTLLDTGDQFGIDTDRIVMVGSSAGGNLAAAVTHHLQKENRPLAGQVRAVCLSSFFHSFDQITDCTF